MNSSLPTEVLISPWGHVHGVNGDFLINAEAAREIESAFKSRGHDLLVDYEHQTLGGPFARDDGLAPAAGWIKSLRTVAGSGIYGTVEWTKNAAKALAEKAYRYLSPVVIANPLDRKAVMLHSVALTNTPAIQGMPAIINSERVAEGYLCIPCSALPLDASHAVNAKTMPPNNTIQQRGGFWETVPERPRAILIADEEYDRMLAWMKNKVDLRTYVDSRLADAEMKPLTDTEIAELEAESADDLSPLDAVRRAVGLPPTGGASTMTELHPAVNTGALAKAGRRADTGAVVNAAMQNHDRECVISTVANSWAKHGGTSGTANLAEAVNSALCREGLSPLSKNERARLTSDESEYRRAWVLGRASTAFRADPFMKSRTSEVAFVNSCLAQEGMRTLGANEVNGSAVL